MGSRAWQWGVIVMGSVALAQLGTACKGTPENLPDENDLPEAGADVPRDISRPDTGSDAASGDSEASDGQTDVHDGGPDAADGGGKSDADAGDTGPDGDAGDGGPDADADIIDGSGPADAEAGTSDAANDTGCASPANVQVFSATMYGCPGTVIWGDRATLCNSACVPCDAGTWAALDGSIPPTHHYWVEEKLERGGTGTPGICAALEKGGGGENCNAVWDGSVVPSPMRVCTSLDASATLTEDPEGNGCSIFDCGFNGSPPTASNVYFGGCNSFPTAGTLCCCP